MGHTQQSICRAQTPSCFQCKKQGQNSAEWLEVLGILEWWWWLESGQNSHSHRFGLFRSPNCRFLYVFFYMWYIMDPTLFLLITGVVPCECNTFLYIERPTFNPKTSVQFYGNCKENKVNGIRGCYVNPGSSCHDAKPSVIGSPYRWSVEACKLREEQQQKGQYVVLGINSIVLKYQQHLY